MRIDFYLLNGVYGKGIPAWLTKIEVVHEEYNNEKHCITELQVCDTIASVIREKSLFVPH